LYQIECDIDVCTASSLVKSNVRYKRHANETHARNIWSIGMIN